MVVGGSGLLERRLGLLGSHLRPLRLRAVVVHALLCLLQRVLGLQPSGQSQWRQPQSQLHRAVRHEKQHVTCVWAWLAYCSASVATYSHQANGKENDRLSISQEGTQQASQ